MRDTGGRHHDAHDDTVDMVRDAAARLFADQVDDALREAAEAAEMGAGSGRLDAFARECEAIGLMDAMGESPSIQALPIAAAVASEAGRHAVPLPIVEAMVARWAARPLDAPERERIAVAAPAAGRVFARAPRAWRTLHLALRLAQCTGAMEAALARAVRHAAEREQFGRPIAAFQAIQHQLAVAAEESAAARVATDAMIDRLARDGLRPGGMDADAYPVGSDCSIGSGPLPPVPAVAASLIEGPGGPATDAAWRALAIARIRVAEATGIVVETAHQVHGAIGFTREHGLHHLTRRLMAWRDDHGGEAHWAAALGAHLAARGPLWELMTGDD